MRFRRPAGRRDGRASPLLLEIGVIVFSVLVALAANEWRQSVARNATVASVLGTLTDEVSANRVEVERALAHHRDLVRQLTSGGIELRRLDLGQVALDTTSEERLARSLFDVARAMGGPFREEFRARRLPDGRWEVDTGEEPLWLTIRGDTAIIRGTGNIALQPPFLLDSAWETAQATHAAVYMDPEIVAAMARIRQLQRRMDATVSRLTDILYGTAAARANPVPALQDLVWFEQAMLDAYETLLALLSG